MNGFNVRRYIEYFEMVWSKNKARGLAAQVYLKMEFSTGRFKKHNRKLFQGCWLTSPKSMDFYKFRMSTFVHDGILTATSPTLHPEDLLGDQARPFYAISEFMNNAGIGVSYAIATTDTGDINFDAIMDKDYSGMNWHMFLYEREEFVEKFGGEIFSTWGERGRPGYARKPWENEELKEAFAGMTHEQLDGLILNELFYTGYMKTILRRPTNDPYDVDGFIVSLSQKHIFPIELKEKFPVLEKRERYFGIDAGRIMMLLRLCIPNNTDALYIVREMNREGEFIGWKYITLSEMIMKSSWNLQGGGKGMGGGDTQTVKIPYDEFSDMSESTFDEQNLQNMANMPENVRRTVTGYQALHKDRFSTSQNGV